MIDEPAADARVRGLKQRLRQMKAAERLARCGRWTIGAIVGTTQDVTPQHEILAQLRLKDLAVESAVNAIAITDLEGSPE